MTSISPDDSRRPLADARSSDVAVRAGLARDLLDRCVVGDPPGELPQALLDDPSGQALFGILVEGLADRFEPALCEVYVQLFARAVASAVGGAYARDLVDRYDRVRKVRTVEGDPSRVFVLSRVTLGADVAVTSVMLDAVKRRFPGARISFVGPAKNFELFAGDPRIDHVPVAYRRGSLIERLAVWNDLKAALSDADSIVIDPDSRLTQLGILPVCPEDRYYFFESRAYRAETTRALSQLSADWAAETFGIDGAKPWVAPVGSEHDSPPYIALNLGVGENPAKRIPDPFESRLLSLLSQSGMPLYLDKGAGGEETGRVMTAANHAGVTPTYWNGSFAGFASVIAGSKLYVGYDSAGQHVAAACKIPMITVFTGFPAPRMFERWKAVGEQCRIIRVDPGRGDPVETLSFVQDALSELGMIW